MMMMMMVGLLTNAVTNSNTIGRVITSGTFRSVLCYAKHELYVIILKWGKRERESESAFIFFEESININMSALGMTFCVCLCAWE